MFIPAVVENCQHLLGKDTAYIVLAGLDIAMQPYRPVASDIAQIDHSIVVAGAVAAAVVGS